ncbi:MAG: hypothetical protein HY289_10075 [Planctomycetes bacterium]|nr:hypothetical protein [Planctomycetota bacterium]
MPSREDQWYEIATREVGEKNFAPSAWGRAFSESLGNMQVALALYIKVRVAQLEREYREKLASGFCEKCDRQITPKRRQRDFFEALFSGKPLPIRRPSYYYLCPSCGNEVAGPKDL